MNRRTRARSLSAACLAVLLACVSVCAAQSQGNPDPSVAAGIPESEIASLQKELTQLRQASSSVRKRRACKSIVRKGAALVDASPAAPNRFGVLAIMLQSQKRLLMLENSERNRDALYDTCSKLALAPDAQAKLRVDADFILSEKALTLKNADLKERAVALAGLIKRYRDTSGEAKSLMMASRIAPKLEAYELEKQISQAMSQRFANDLVMIEFRLKHTKVNSIDAPFTGTFTRLDGTTLKFPADQLGHACLMVFWSKQAPGIEEYLKQIKVQAGGHSDLLKIFSFNVDELPDAGQKILRDLELDWTVMRLPGGKNSQAFGTYGQVDSVALLVNAYGRTLIVSELAKYGYGQTAETGYVFSDKAVAHDRFLAQLQSLFIGDFLVTDTGLGDKQVRTVGSVPAKTLSAIQACFTVAPMRYRLTDQKSLANYTKAEKLCRDAIAKHPKAPDLWRVRNRRIIALLGMWNMATEPKHLKAAAAEARTTLTATLPRGANVVSQFCLAKAALRQGDVDAKSLLSDLIKETGGTDGPPSAQAAATILALDARSKELHMHYREMLLKTHNESPMLWPVVSFLRERYHNYFLLAANDVRRERRFSRRHIINHGGATTNPLPAIELKTLDGGKLSLPKDTNGKLTLLVFVEPPADANAEMPRGILGKPAQGKKREGMGTLLHATRVAGWHIYKEVNVVAAFVSDDVDRIKAVVKTNGVTCQVAMVPGGLKNPMMRRLGILSADRVANVFLLRRDGTIAWKSSGLKFKGSFSHVFSVYLAMAVQIEVIEITRAYKALQRGEYQEAARIFAGPFPTKKDERFGWTAPRFHGRALANMGLKDWKTALVDIDRAITEHERGYNRKKQHLCDSMVKMYRTKATILDKLGRAADAKAAKEYAATPTRSYRTTVYDLFHGKLKKVTLK